MIRIIYFGTPDFSATVLEALAKNNNFDIVAVVTQPARPVGRNQTITPSPVKVSALKLGLNILEPETLKDFSPEKLPSADIFVVYAYGLIIPKSILEIPRYGALNIHPSLLPKYRGPTPIQAALMNGDTTTGVSIMVLDEKMDHGPILECKTLDIDPEDTTITLTKKLVDLAIPMLIDLIPAWINKQITPKEQNHNEASYCKILSRDDGKIDWQKSAQNIYNLYRALTPWPGIWTIWENKRLKLLQIKITPYAIPAGKVHIEGNHFFIGCKNNSIEVTELQLEGKKPMSSNIFLQGYKHIDQTIFS